MYGSLNENGRCLFVDVIIDARWSDATLARPWINLRARLTRSHVSHTRLVPQVTHFWIVTALWPILIVTLEWLERVHARQWRRVTHPLQRLPIGHYPNVIHRIDCVQEFDESFLVVRLCEPSGMVEQTEWCSATKWERKTDRVLEISKRKIRSLKEYPKAYLLVV